MATGRRAGPGLDPPRLSVIIPARDMGHTIGRCLEGLQRQVAPPAFEVIVVDDGSENGTATIARSYRSRLALTVLVQEASGANMARNLGAQHARGRHLAFLDADDEVAPGWARTMGRLLESPSVAVASCGAVYVDGAGMPGGERTPGPMGPAFGGITGLFLAGTYAVERSLFQRVGGFQEDQPSLQHTAFLLRLAADRRSRDWDTAWTCRRLVTIHSGRVGHRTHSAAFAERRLAGTQLLLERFGSDLAQDPALLARYLAVAGVCAARLGRYVDARTHFAAAARLCPTSGRLWLRYAVAWAPAVARRMWPVAPG